VTTAVVVVFLLVYLGMILGGLPFLQLDRTGVALLGAIALIAMEAVSPEQAAAGRSTFRPSSLSSPSWWCRPSSAWAVLPLGDAKPRRSALVAAPGCWAAVVVVDRCAVRGVQQRHRLPVRGSGLAAWRVMPRGACAPVPFLLALACAANVGSAATLIGNPQNMLIGSALRLPFGAYVAEAAVPVLLGLIVTWRSSLFRRGDAGRRGPAGRRRRPIRAATTTSRHSTLAVHQGPAGRGRSCSWSFLFTDWPRGTWPPGRGRRAAHLPPDALTSMLGLVDWEAAGAVRGPVRVNHAFEATRLPAAVVSDLRRHGIHLEAPATLFGATFCSRTRSPTFPR
jgi:hypothetical protein